MSKKKGKRKILLSKKKLPLFFRLIIRNLISFLIMALVITLLYQSVYGYSWLWNGIIDTNLSFIQNYPDLTIEEKSELKQKPDANFIYIIKDHTQDTSSILFPPRDILRNNERKYKNLNNRAWVTYFLYPRKFTYFDELADTSDLSGFNYLLVFNYWGYDKLPYSNFMKKKRDALLPINFKKR